MILRAYKRLIILSVMLSFASASGAQTLPILGGISSGGGGLQMLGSLPIIDGRGVPVVGGLEGASLIAMGVSSVVLSNPNLTGERGLSADFVGQLLGIMQSGGPTLDFLALDSIFEL